MSATFSECVMAAAKMPEFVENYDRLTGAQLSRLATRGPLERMIDETTGRERDEIIRFLAFVYEFVYCRLPVQP